MPFHSSVQPPRTVLSTSKEEGKDEGTRCLSQYPSCLLPIGGSASDPNPCSELCVDYKLRAGILYIYMSENKVQFLAF